MAERKVEEDCAGLPLDGRLVQESGKTRVCEEWTPRQENGNVPRQSTPTSQGVTRPSTEPGKRSELEFGDIASLASSGKDPEGKDKTRGGPENEPHAPREHPPTARRGSFEENAASKSVCSAESDEQPNVDRKSTGKNKVDTEPRLEGASTPHSSIEESDIRSKQYIFVGSGLGPKDTAHHGQKGKSSPEHPHRGQSSSFEESDTSMHSSESDSRSEIESDYDDHSRNDPEGKNKVAGHNSERRRPEGKSEPPEENDASTESDDQPKPDYGYVDNPASSTVDSTDQSHHDPQGLQSSLLPFIEHKEPLQTIALTSKESNSDIVVQKMEAVIEPAYSDELNDLSEQYSCLSDNAEEQDVHTVQEYRKATKKLAQGYKHEKAKHARTKQKITELESDKEQLQRHIDVLQSRNASLASELSSVKEQLTSAEQRRDELHQTLQELRLSARTDTVDIDTLEQRDKEIDKLRSEIAQLANELSQATDKVKQLEADKAKLENAIFMNERTIISYEQMFDPESFNIVNYAAQSENRKCRVCYRVADPEMCSKCNRLKSEHRKKDGICKKFKKQKISKSHAYGEKLLQTACRGNYPAVWDYGADNQRTPSECKWPQQCNGCDSATGYAENNFDGVFGVTMDEPSKYYPHPMGDSNCRIQVDHADLLHVYTFRALCHNVDINHYFIASPGSESDCTCNHLFPSIQAFLKKAHHLCRPAVWNGREYIEPTDTEVSSYIDPTDAGMVFHLRQSSIPEHHFIEFPIICEVQLTSTGPPPSCHPTSSERDSKRPPQSASSYTLIYAQIPPFYWAFPLVEPVQALPDVFSESIKTASILVKQHYKEVKTKASTLLPHFPRIIDAVNNVLHQEKQAVFKPGSSAQLWRDTELMKRREDRDAKEAELERLRKENSVKEENNEKERQSIRSQRSELENEEEGLKKRKDDLQKQKLKARTKPDKWKLENQIKDIVAQQSKLPPKIKELNDKDSKLRQEESEFFREYDDIASKEKKLIEEGLYADFTPKLILTYLPCCCLKVIM